jgi:hypothetical protein
MDIFQYPWDPPSAPVTLPGVSDAPPTRPKPRGRRKAALSHRAGQGAGAFWLFHQLTIYGPAETAVAFAAAARGSGVIPWRLAGADLEDTVFNLAVSQPARDRKLTVEGCRILARQFRDRVESHQARAAALVGHSFLCPFDLHTLLPVPPSILQLGPTDPAALSWLSQHWGVTDRLRQVAAREKPTTGRRLRRGHAVIGYGFFTAGDTPHAAVVQLAARWPALRFRLVPRPAA